MAAGSLFWMIPVAGTAGGTGWVLESSPSAVSAKVPVAYPQRKKKRLTLQLLQNISEPIQLGLEAETMFLLLFGVSFHRRQSSGEVGLACARRVDWNSLWHLHAQAAGLGLVLLIGVGGDQLLDRDVAFQSLGNIAFLCSVPGGVGMCGMGMSGMGLGRAKRQSVKWARSSRPNVSEGELMRVHRGSLVRGAAESHSGRGALKMRRGLVPVVHVRKAVKHARALVLGRGGITVIDVPLFEPLLFYQLSVNRESDAGEKRSKVAQVTGRRCPTYLHDYCANETWRKRSSSSLMLLLKAMPLGIVVGIKAGDRRSRLDA